MKIVVPEDVSGTCVAAGERIDFQLKAGRHTAKTPAEIDTFRHLVDAGLASEQGSTDTPAPAEKE